MTIACAMLMHNLVRRQDARRAGLEAHSTGYSFWPEARAPFDMYLYPFMDGCGLIALASLSSVRRALCILPIAD